MKEQEADVDALHPLCPDAHREFARATFHRFQNHLQGLLGLLAMRRQEATPVALEIIDEVAGQIAVIASVYRVKGDSETLRVGLKELAAAVVRGASGALPVILETSEEYLPVYVQERETVNIALALQGLLRHTAAHARRTVSLTVDREGDTVILSLVGDAPALGAGAQREVASASDPGIALVESLLPPAGADLAVGGGDGAVCELRLSPPVIAIDRGPP